MSKNLKILIFLDHDIMIRHFILSGVFKPLMEKHDVLFVFPEPTYKDGQRISFDPEQLNLGNSIRYLEIPQIREKLWTKLSKINYLRWRPGRQRALMRTMTRATLGPKALRDFTRLTIPGIYHLFERRTLKKLSENPNIPLDGLIADEKPDMMIHPTVLYGPFVHDLCWASKERGIPFVSIMNSWDNIVTKAEGYLKLDWLFVWGEQTKIHAYKYCDIQREKVVVFGPAQFDVYREPARMERDEFCRLHGIDPSKKLLLYAGASRDLDEFAHLSALDYAIEQGELENTAVIYRPHPWGNCGIDGARIPAHKWRHVFFEHSCLDYIERVAKHSGEHHRSYPDYRNSNDVMHVIDALITPLSTMLLESGLRGIPTLCHLPHDEGAENFKQVRNLSHFDEMYDRPEFLKSYGNEEFLPKVKLLLEQIGNAAHAENLRDTSRFFAESFDRTYGDRLVEFVENVCPS